MSYVYQSTPKGFYPNDEFISCKSTSFEQVISEAKEISVNKLHHKITVYEWDDKFSKPGVNVASAIDGKLVFSANK